MSRFRRGSAVLIVLSNLFTSALALLSAPLIARAIGPDGRGESAAAIAAFTIVPIVIGFGLPLAIRRAAAVGDGADAIRTFRLINAALIIPSSLLGFLAGQTVFADFDGTARLVAVAGIVLAPFTVSWMGDASVLVARERYWSIFVLRTLQPGLFMLAILVGFVWLDMSVAYVLVSQVLSSLCTALAGVLLNRVSLTGTFADPVALIREGSRYAGSGIAEAASYRLDQIIILPLAGAFQTGLYSVAATIGAAPLAVGQALSAPLYRQTARASSEHRHDVVADGIRAASSAGALASVSAGLVAAPLIPVLFGTEFSGSVIPMLIVLIGTFGSVIAVVASFTLAAQGRGIVMTAAQVLGLCVSTAILIVLAPTLGAIGAAVASSIGYLALVVFLVRALRVNPRMLVPSVAGLRIAYRTMFRSPGSGT